MTGKSAMAKCHKNDLFDTYYGIGIAYCRLKGIKIKEQQSLKGCIVYCDDEEQEFYVVEDEDSSLILLESDKYENNTLCSSSIKLGVIEIVSYCSSIILNASI